MLRIKELTLLETRESLKGIPEGKVLINTINAHSFNIAQKDKLFARALAEGDYLIPDGMSIVKACRWLNAKSRPKERVAGWDLFWFEMERIEQKGKQGDGKDLPTVMFVGSSEKVLSLIKARAANDFPHLNIATYSPPYKKSFSDDDSKVIVQTINEVNPDLLWIGMTAPKQEIWTFSHWNELHINCHVGTIGAVFDFYAGTAKRAPQWWQKHSIEWLYRLLREPRRMWKRYMVGNPLFLWNVWRQKVNDTTPRLTDLLFFDLLQVALGNRDSLRQTPSETEWDEIFTQAKRHTLIGIAFSGVERLPQEQRPYKILLLRWYTIVDKIEKQNQTKNVFCMKMQEKFLKNGFRTCIIKGLGVARYYAQPLRRQCGDIDIWVEGGWKKVVKYLYEKELAGSVAYHHMDLGHVDGVKVEIHFKPSWMFNPFKNKQLQAWFKNKEEQQFSNKVIINKTDYAIDSKEVDTLSENREQANADIKCVFPTDSFNATYLLLHMYRHIFDDGLGLRQLVDYYTLLSKQSLSKEEMEETLHTVKKLGMTRFAKAVAWILVKVFGLKKECIFVAPDEKQGRFLFDEVMQSGNFGQFDERMNLQANEGKWHKFFRRQKRNLRFLRSYPSEVLWRPFFILFHIIWRINASRYISKFMTSTKSQE